MLSKEEFVAQWASVSIQDLRAAVRAQGMTLSAKSKAEAVEEAWGLYSGANSAEAVPVLDSPAVSPREAVGAPSGPLTYEARVFGLNGINTRRRAGFLLDRQWQDLGSPSAEQLLALRADKAFVQLRVKG